MTKKEKVENDAYMVLNELAFGFRKTDNGLRIVAINLKNLDQRASFRVREKDLLLCESNMSKENTYKTMLIVERNKARLIEGMNTWANMQKTK